MLKRNKLIELLESGEHLILDRYAFSGVAFTSVKVLQF